MQKKKKWKAIKGDKEWAKEAYPIIADLRKKLEEAKEIFFEERNTAKAAGTGELFEAGRYLSSKEREDDPEGKSLSSKETDLDQMGASPASPAPSTKHSGCQVIFLTFHYGQKKTQTK